MGNTYTVWAFDLGKGSIGDMSSPLWRDLNRLRSGERNSPEAAACGAERAGLRVSQRGRRSDEVNTNLHHQFLHKDSLLILANFEENKKGADRLREAPYGSHRSYLAAKAAWLFPTIDTARLVLIHQKTSNALQ